MCVFSFRANWKMFQSTVKKRSSENLSITFSNLQSLNDTHCMYNIKKLNWAEDGWGCHRLAHGHRRQTAVAPRGYHQSDLRGGLSCFQSGSSLGGTKHQGQWSVQHFPLSSKSNREEGHMHTDLCHLGPTIKANLAFSPQS